MGLIPAHAGKTARTRVRLAKLRAHPRACGENQYVCGKPVNNGGSSPRMRGKPLFYRHGEPIGGLIPAHAGKTLIDVLKVPARRAHPRACGENVALFEAWENALGSSPRMRGKHSITASEWETRGLIPAHAGKTHPHRRSVSNAWAHPRACGENTRVKAAMEKESGSSPRMRGKLMGAPFSEKLPRLIPAHAGKTSSRGWAASFLRAHPRACGENFIRHPTKSSGRGSSPRMRGKL